MRTARYLYVEHYRAEVPTLAEGETWEDLRGDRSAFEEFNVEAAGRRGMHYAALDQLAVEHLLGARS